MIESVFGFMFAGLFISLFMVLVYSMARAFYIIVVTVLDIVWSILTWPFRLSRPGWDAPTPIRWEDVPPVTPAEPASGYTRDWAAVSQQYRESRGWRCEECGVYCGSNGDRHLLHVHHRDRDPQNNEWSNLDALCVVCHSERPGTGHRRLAGAITSDGRRWSVEQLRRQQGR